MPPRSARAQHGLPRAGDDCEVSRDANSRPTKVKLRWIESGGPEVTPPSHRGFGMRLLRVMAQDVDGTAELIFDPAGVQWEVQFPLLEPSGSGSMAA